MLDFVKISATILPHIDPRIVCVMYFIMRSQELLAVLKNNKGDYLL